MEYFVYLLESEKDGGFYIGQTNNIKRRLELHNRGKVRATKSRKPFHIVGYEAVDSRKEALALEKTLKSHSDKKLKFIKKFCPEFKWKLPG